jgi:hypothetical protein
MSLRLCDTMETKPTMTSRIEDVSIVGQDVMAPTGSAEGNGPGPKREQIDMSGPWRKVCSGGYWWVVGHHMMYPAHTEERADMICETKRGQWREQ